MLTEIIMSLSSRNVIVKQEGFAMPKKWRHAETDAQKAVRMAVMRMAAVNRIVRKAV